MQKKLLKIILVPFLLVLPALVFAQDKAMEDDNAGLADMPPAPANTVSCFDYYTFGSVKAQISASVSNTVSGGSITFSGSLVNDNPYPIVDGAFYVKVFKTRSGQNDGNGPDVVDQFIVKGDIVIPAKSSVPVSFDWKVPSYAQTGDYQLATFFTTSRKFNLLGLTFTDDVVGNTVPFKVTGEGSGSLTFDKSSVKINDDSYHFAAFPPRLDAKTPATLTARIHNTNTSDQKATLSWSVYQWDAQLRENVVEEQSSQITVPAGGELPVSIAVTDTKYPVYYVIGAISWKDTKSIIGARFVREGVDRLRINFPGVTDFPLKKDQATTLFSCLHNSGSNNLVSGGSLDLLLTDRSGNVIDKYRYDGDVTSAMMGIASKFTPKKDYDYFTLSARLFQGGKFVDEANLVYDCNEINPSLCTQGTSSDSIPDFMDSIKLIGGAAGALVLILLLLWLYRKVAWQLAGEQPLL